ncbi:MAG: hypothetical protein DHS20C21_01640 [Gemmatimonadota bacterium]|nr:MAG: hypothetical protein DHS20C21_01640 [Gemmatimonadota bacterium]
MHEGRRQKTEEKCDASLRAEQGEVPFHEIRSFAGISKIELGHGTDVLCPLEYQTGGWNHKPERWAKIPTQS